MGGSEKEAGDRRSSRLPSSLRLASAKSEDGKRAEAVGVVVQEHLVEGGERSRGFGLADGGRPDGVAGQRRDDGGLDPLAADVADDHAPVVRA